MLCIEGYKAQGQEVVASEGTCMMRHSTHASAQPAPPGSAAAVHDSAPAPAEVPEHRQLHTAHRGWSMLQR